MSDKDIWITGGHHIRGWHSVITDMDKYARIRDEIIKRFKPETGWFNEIDHAIFASGIMDGDGVIEESGDQRCLLIARCAARRGVSQSQVGTALEWMWNEELRYTEASLEDAYSITANPHAMTLHWVTHAPVTWFSSGQIVVTIPLSTGSHDR